MITDAVFRNLQALAVTLLSPSIQAAVTIPPKLLAPSTLIPATAKPARTKPLAPLPLLASRPWPPLLFPPAG